MWITSRIVSSNVSLQLHIYIKDLNIFQLSTKRFSVYSDKEYLQAIIVNPVSLHPVIQNLLQRCRSFYYPADIYLLKVNNGNTRTRCEICPKLTVKTPEHSGCPGTFIVSFEHISHLVLVFLLLTLNMWLPAGNPVRCYVLINPSLIKSSTKQLLKSKYPFGCQSFGKFLHW